MKTLLLASIFCCAVHAQDSAASNVWGVVKGIQNSHKTCSVPLGNAHIGVTDPRLAIVPGTSVPSCENSHGSPMLAAGQLNLLTLPDPLPQPLPALDLQAVKNPLQHPVLLEGAKISIVTPKHGEGICSVPLLGANADAFDPGIATKPGGSPVPIRHARVPAPPCR